MVRRITLSWPYSIAAILMLMVMLAMAALATLGVFASTANAQANGGNPPDVESAEAGGEFAGKFAEIAAGGADGGNGSPAPTPPTGGPALLLPVASLLLGSGILTYTILRRG